MLINSYTCSEVTWFDSNHVIKRNVTCLNRVLNSSTSAFEAKAASMSLHNVEVIELYRGFHNDWNIIRYDRGHNDTSTIGHVSGNNLLPPSIHFTSPVVKQFMVKALIIILNIFVYLKLSYLNFCKNGSKKGNFTINIYNNDFKVIISYIKVNKNR